jgi:RNA polymerase sigma-70 factor, ECF subfamily
MVFPHVIGILTRAGTVATLQWLEEPGNVPPIPRWNGASVQPRICVGHAIAASTSTSTSGAPPWRLAAPPCAQGQAGLTAHLDKVIGRARRLGFQDHVVLDTVCRQDAMYRSQSTMVARTEEEPPRVSATESSDTNLVRAARAGDRRACFVIWTRYATLVDRLVRRFLGPGPDYQDVCQEIFLRVFKRLGEVRNPSALQGFVVSVTLGVARNESRRRRIRSIVGLVPDEVMPEVPTSPGQGEAREATRALYQMLDELGTEDRSLFVARFVEKMELGEVAEAHGMSLSTAKRRLARLVVRVNARVEASPVLHEYVGALAQGGRP